MIRSVAWCPAWRTNVLAYGTTSRALRFAEASEGLESHVHTTLYTYIHRRGHAALCACLRQLHSALRRGLSRSVVIYALDTCICIYMYMTPCMHTCTHAHMHTIREGVRVVYEVAESNGGSICTHKHTHTHTHTHTTHAHSKGGANSIRGSRLPRRVHIRVGLAQQRHSPRHGIQ